MTNLLNRKGSDAKPTGETCAELYERLNVGRGMTLRNFQERFNGKNEVRFSMRREVSAKEVAIMEGLYPPIKDKLKRVADKAAVSTPESNVVPGATSKKKAGTQIDWDMVVVRGLLAIGSLAHGLFIWYECGYLWGEGGKFAGALGFILIAVGVALLRKSKNAETSQNLLYMVWVVDCCAWFVHKKALYHGGNNAFAAGIDEYGTGCMAAIICLIAGAFMYFYRETGLKK